MSIYAISWVLQHSETEKVDRLVLIALADYANDDGGGCWASVGKIAAKARCSERTAQYALRRLEDGGHIVKSGVSPRGTNVYRVLFEGGAKAAPPAENPPQGVQESDGGVQKSDGGVQGAAPEPSLEPSSEPSKEPSVKERVQKAFDYWLTIIDDGVDSKRYKLTKERERALKGRLKDSDPEEIRDAMLGAWSDPWCQEKGKWDIAYCLRTRTLLEDFRDRRQRQLAGSNGASANGNGQPPSAHPEYDTTAPNMTRLTIRLIDDNGPLTANQIHNAIGTSPNGDLASTLESTRERLMQMVEDGDCVYEPSNVSSGEGAYARPGEAM